MSATKPRRIVLAARPEGKPRGFINYEFTPEHFPAFLREVGAGIADSRIRYREEIVDGLENAPEAFIGMLEGRNFGKLIVRVDGSRPSREQP